MNSIETTVITEPGLIPLGFPFNYAKTGEDLTREDAIRVEHKSSKSFSVIIRDLKPINAFKFTNTGVRIWNDSWFDRREKNPVDPLIREINLSNSFYLEIFNILPPRPSLNTINLAGCNKLKYFSIVEANNLESLYLDYCNQLETIMLGWNRNLRHISLRGCALRERTMEQFLGAYIATHSDVSYENSYKRTKINYQAYLDLRGNLIQWNNRRIASKIRLLLCNGIAVIWSNNPPETIIPIELYRGLST